MSSLGSVILRSLAGPFLLRPCRKKRPKGTLAPQLEPIEQSRVTSLAREQSLLDTQVDEIVARIDNTTDLALTKRSLLQPIVRAQTNVEAQEPDGNDPPGQYVRCETPCDSPSGVVALARRNEDDGSAIELVDFRSFDLETNVSFRDYNCKDLGGAHSSMHVRSCNSKTCVSCRKDEGVNFVKSKKPAWVLIK